MTDSSFTGSAETPAADGGGRVRLGGRDLGPTEFANAMVHLYRGEVARSNAWRQRLDATTNWAVVSSGAALTFAFGATGNSSLVIVWVSLLVLIFLFIEARRYRYYELWMHRARLLETNFMCGLLSPGGSVREDWTAQVVESLRHPAFPITLLEALGRRYRRNYAPLFILLSLSWVAKVFIHPVMATSWGDFLSRAGAGPLPAWLVLALGVVFNGGLLALGLLTVHLRRSEAEVFGKAPRSYLRLLARIRAATREALDVDLTAIRPVLPSRRKQLVLIISDDVQAIARPLLEELDRGVTMIKGVGMYSGEEHGILMSVVRGRRQLARLRAIVHRVDPKAFVVVTGAQDVRGEGFRPLET